MPRLAPVYLMLSAAALVAGCNVPSSSSTAGRSDGFRVVAEGPPPIGFLMSEKGTVIVTDTVSHNSIYTMTSADGDPVAVIKVEDGKLMFVVPNSGRGEALLTGLDPIHAYRITFRPASAPGAPPPASTPRP